MKLPILPVKMTDKAAFISFWSQYYSYLNESLYTKNIGRPLTKRGLEELFYWKNGGKLSALKAKSVEVNYVAKIPELERLPPETAPAEFLKDFGGGMIWRIFLLHIWRPEQYPIFDQHVFRAMRYIQTGRIEEIPSRDRDVGAVYVDEYLAFYQSFEEMGVRTVDKALWGFGKFLKSQYRSML